MQVDKKIFESVFGKLPTQIAENLESDIQAYLDKLAVSKSNMPCNICGKTSNPNDYHYPGCPKF